MRFGLDSACVKETAANGRLIASSNINVRYLERKDYKYSPVVSKKQGNAVKRNRVKRVIRGIMDSEKGRFPNGYYIIYFRGPCSSVNRDNIWENMKSIVQKLTT